MFRRFLFKKFAKLGYEHVTNDNDPKDQMCISFKKYNSIFHLYQKIDIYRSRLAQSYDEKTGKYCPITNEELSAILWAMLRFRILKLVGR